MENLSTSPIALIILNCIEDVGLQDAGFYGSPFTWCDNRGEPRTIWKRLDKLLINSEWLFLF